MILMITIAIADDEETIRETIAYTLKKEGYHVITFADGGSAWEHFQKELPDLAILDIMMPRIDGLGLCRRIRGLSEQIPLMFLTSRDEEFDRVLGLEIGADDYLCKPFSMRELAARVKVLLKRLHWQNAGQNMELTQSHLQNGTETAPASSGLVIDEERFSAAYNGTAITLTVTEFRLLSCLAGNPGIVRSRADLVEEAYPLDVYVSDRSIDTHIKRLRRKLREAAGDYDPIETIYGMGYRFSEK